MNLCVLQFPLFVPVLIMCMCVGACVLHMGAYRGQKMSDPLKLELQVVASYLIRVPGTKLWSSAKAVGTLSGTSPQCPHP